MKNKILKIVIVFACALSFMTIAMYVMYSDSEDEDKIRYQIVKLNEISQLSKNNNNDKQDELADTIDELSKSLKNDVKQSGKNSRIIKVIMSMYILCMLFLVGTFIYIYIRILRPYDKLKDYAESIANGNFDNGLDYERMNLFGDFTWAFDHMRKEIIRARSYEKEAVENNKTFIATLSHDIKTPIASIRAYTEALEANLDKSVDRRERYIRVIISKCDEVVTLTNDLFLHSISDMEQLKIEPCMCDIKLILEDIIEEYSAISTIDIEYDRLDSATLYIDSRRLKQAITNIIDNSRKYAADENNLAKITITTSLEANQYVINLRDYGKGILDEDMPFVMQKFYRGNNARNQAGAGLGLHIVRYIISQMDGELHICNSDKGLTVTIVLKNS